MTQEDPIRLFVSHIYEPDEEYFRVFEYLESAVNFFYKNLGAPDKPPRKPDKESLKEALRGEMKDAELVMFSPQADHVPVLEHILGKMAAA